MTRLLIPFRWRPFLPRQEAAPPPCCVVDKSKTLNTGSSPSNNTSAFDNNNTTKFTSDKTTSIDKNTTTTFTYPTNIPPSVEATCHTASISTYNKPTTTGNSQPPIFSTDTTAGQLDGDDDSTVYDEVSDDDSFNPSGTQRLLETYSINPYRNTDRIRPLDSNDNDSTEYNKEDQSLVAEYPAYSGQVDAEYPDYSGQNRDSKPFNRISERNFDDDDSDTDSQKQSRYYDDAYFLEKFKNAPKIPGRTYQKARQANDRTILPTKIYTSPPDSTIDDAMDTTEYIVFDDKIDRRSDDDDDSEEDYAPNYSYNRASWPFQHKAYDRTKWKMNKESSLIPTTTDTPHYKRTSNFFGPAPLPDHPRYKPWYDHFSHPIPSCPKVAADNATNDTKSTIDDATAATETIVLDDKIDQKSDDDDDLEFYLYKGPSAPFTLRKFPRDINNITTTTNETKPAVNSAMSPIDPATDLG